MFSRVALALASLAPVFAVGCTMPVAPAQSQLYWPEPAVRYYGISLDVLKTDDSLSVTNYAKALNDSLGKELKRGTKIAFRPPDKCRDVEADTGALANDRLMKSECGSLLGALENVAAQRGYEVVSYKYLKDTSTIEASDRFDIDVVFEIDELSLSSAAGGTTTYGSVLFFEQQNEDVRTPVNVHKTVWDRCKSYIEGYERSLGGGRVDGKEWYGGTLSAKAVSAKRGVALFSYRKFLRLEGSGDTGSDRGALEVYFASDGSYAESPPPPPPSPIAHHVSKHRVSKKALKTGLSLLGVGVSSYFIGYAIDQTEDGPQDAAIALGIVGITFMALGSVAAIGGGAGMIGHKVAAEKKLAAASRDYVLPPASAPVYAAPEQVLCRGERQATPPWIVEEAASGSPPEEQSSSVFTFETSDKQGVSQEALENKSRQETSRKIADDMFNEIERYQ